MVKLYRSLSYFSMENILYDNEGFFNNNINGKRLSNLSKEAMQKVDKSELIDINLSTIKTPYGICNIKCLSTGCKTVLNTIYIMEHKEEYEYIKAVNATECGWNALEVLFDIVDRNDYNIGLIIEHMNELFNCNERRYLINGEKEIRNLLWM
ncbi:DUF4869 domain-containing protein [Candidatus Ventrimonas sp. KK005]